MSDHDEGSASRPIGLPDGKPIYYLGEQSVITVAPPRSGKVRCSLLAALVMDPAPASLMVIDPKAELFSITAAHATHRPDDENHAPS